MKPFLRALGALAVLGFGAWTAAQTTGPAKPPLVIHSVAGEDLFRFYCATCHGRAGAGDGPVAQALKAAPPDLRLLARANGGTFPRSRVEMLVSNDGSLRSPSHGTTEMPVWGPVFKGLDASGTMAEIRIANLVRYIESIQQE